LAFMRKQGLPICPARLAGPAIMDVTSG